MPNKIIDGMIRGQAGLDSIGTIISAFQSERVIAQGFSGALKIGQSLLRAIVVDDSSTNNSADIVARSFVEDEGVSLLHKTIPVGLLRETLVSPPLVAIGLCSLMSTTTFWLETMRRLVTWLS